MFDFLPPFLKRLYQSLRNAKPSARATRAPAEPDPTPDIAVSMRERIFRVEIVQDAFCERRPIASSLFRKPGGHRDRESWCERRGNHLHHHRCPTCEDLRTLYADACRGDWRAECRLHRLATRATIRLLAERRAWQESRCRHRAARTPGPPPPPGVWASLGWARWRERRAAEPTPWFIAERRAAEARLVRAHASKLRRMAQRHSARLRDRQMARDAAGPKRKAQSAVSPGTGAADRRRPGRVEPPPDAPAPTRSPRGPQGGATIIKFGAGRRTSPPPGARKDGAANGRADSDPALQGVVGDDGHAAALALAQHVDGRLEFRRVRRSAAGADRRRRRSASPAKLEDHVARPQRRRARRAALGDLRDQHAGACIGQSSARRRRASIGTVCAVTPSRRGARARRASAGWRLQTRCRCRSRSRCPAPAAIIAVLMPTTAAGAGHQRAAGIARVQRRVGLDDAVDQAPRAGAQACGRAR